MNSKRALLARLAGAAPVRSTLNALGAWRGVLVLAYHRVGHYEDLPFDRGTWSATPEEFERQVAFLARHFELVRGADLPRALASRAAAVLITFDDGYRDNYEHALPALRAHGAPAVFFVSTGVLDRPAVAWWDDIAWMVRASDRPEIPGDGWMEGPLSLEPARREHAIAELTAVYKSLPAHRTEAFLGYVGAATGSGRCDPGAAAGQWLTWDMVREMRACGLEIGGHTVSHTVLARLPASVQTRELEGCKQRIEEELGEPMALFSYPVGMPGTFDSHTRGALERLGVRAAFSCYGGYARRGHQDRYDIPRTTVGVNTSAALLSATVALPQLFARY
jgi:peptidoglycan/xylan/chitin deacetylase (PgdA/CDA1 family)